MSEELINTPGTVWYRIARAKTLDDWYVVYTTLQGELKQAIEVGLEDGIDLDADMNITTLNAMLTMAERIVGIMTIAKRVWQGD